MSFDPIAQLVRAWCLYNVIHEWDHTHIRHAKVTGSSPVGITF
jgi:hypothetical protein